LADKLPCGIGLTVIVAELVVKPELLIQVFASVTETKVYAVVLKTGVVKVAKDVPLITLFAVRLATPSL
jgi:hypothetical protein